MKGFKMCSYHIWGWVMGTRTAPLGYGPGLQTMQAGTATSIGPSLDVVRSTTSEQTQTENNGPK